MNSMMNSVWRHTARSVRAISVCQKASGRLWAPGARSMCSSSSEEVLKNMEQMVKKDKVVVFMKGTPEQPMCGFSNAVVQILRMHGVDEYTAYNVLEKPELRQGVKAFSNWPTIPQVFFNGEFVGGCDILLQMHQSGDLMEELDKLGIRSALLDTHTPSK